VPPTDYAAAFGFLGRHASALLLPQSPVVKDFAAYVRKNMQCNLDVQMIDFPSYLLSVDSCKRNLYQSGYDFFKQNLRIPSSFEVM